MWNMKTNGACLFVDKTSPLEKNVYETDKGLMINDNYPEKVALKKTTSRLMGENIDRQKTLV
jgi:hypothetical protein